MARAGLCSRRDAERWIAEGRVAVDGAVLTSPAVTVTADNDIRVDGKPLPQPQRARLWRYHKPAGLVTTHRDEKGRPTVFDALPKELPRLISIGRLDLNSEGLLLLTNDGALARRLELPATGWMRRYKVRVHGMVDPARLAALADGITIDGVAYGPIRAGLERNQGSNAWIAMALSEGKNREVRRVLEHLGLQVTRLIRLSYGPFQLGNLERGDDRRGAAKSARRTARRPSPRNGRRMRIVGGSHRGRRLAAPPGDAVRPTSDRAREAMFDILSHGAFAAEGPPFADAAVLDAFAGTGAFGLEALSRGAAEAVFIENDRAALAALRHNIADARRGGAQPGRRRRRDPAAARAGRLRRCVSRPAL